MSNIDGFDNNSQSIEGSTTDVFYSVVSSSVVNVDDLNENTSGQDIDVNNDVDMEGNDIKDLGRLYVDNITERTSGVTIDNELKPQENVTMASTKSLVFPNEDKEDKILLKATTHKIGVDTTSQDLVLDTPTGESISLEVNATPLATINSSGVQVDNINELTGSAGVTIGHELKPSENVTMASAKALVFPDEVKEDKILLYAGYEIGVNSAANHHMDIPTGKSYNWKINDAPKLSLTTTGLRLQYSGVTTNRLVKLDGSSELDTSDLVNWVAGTTDQITVTDDTDGTITLSLPQSINTTSSPTFAAVNTGFINNAGTIGIGTTGADRFINLSFDTGSPETALYCTNTTGSKWVAVNPDYTFKCNGMVSLSNADITIDALDTASASAITLTNSDGTYTTEVTMDSAIVSDLTASRLMVSGSSKELESVSDLTSWIAGTANEITVTDDTDGSVTLSLPLTIQADKLQGSTASTSVSLDKLTFNTATTDLSDITSSDTNNTIRATSSNNVGLEISRGATNKEAVIRLRTASANEWLIGMDDVTDSLDCQFYGYDVADWVLRLRQSDGAVFMPQVYGDTVTGEILYIDSNGQLGQTSSLTAHKTNILDIGDVSWIYNLNPKKFNYRKKESEDTYSATEYHTRLEYGLLAEDVSVINDEVCNYTNKKTHVKDCPDEHKSVKERCTCLCPSTKTLTGVGYNRLITPLLKCIQNQKSEINILKNRVSLLESYHP
jgi:hypothetical protein